MIRQSPVVKHRPELFDDSEVHAHSELVVQRSQTAGCALRLTPRLLVLKVKPPSPRPLVPRPNIRMLPAARQLHDRQRDRRGLAVQQVGLL